jgi:tetratricopeptide (TPR) repeat protein
MEGLPLALDQAGAYILETGCSFAEYREQCIRRRAEFLARRGKRFIGHEASVAITFSLAFERVEALNPAAADLLCACALLCSEAIPEEIFWEGASHLGSLLSAGRALWDMAIGVLHDYSLVQAVIKDTMDTSTFRLWAKRVVDAVEATWSKKEYHSTTGFERLLAHAQSCAQLIEACHLTSQAAMQLLYQTGVYLAEHVRYAEAEALYLQSLHLREQVLGPMHPEVAYPLYVVAELYREQGKYSEAAPLYQRAIRIWRQALGPDYPELAYPLRGLAELYHMQGNYLGAEPLYQEALHIEEYVIGPEHRQLASLLSCLANLYREQGKYGEAESLYQRALRMDEQAVNETHPAGSPALQGLAELYSDQGRYEEAEALYLQALQNFEHVLDPDHPRIAPLLHNLANVYVDEGKFHEAEMLYKRAIRIQEQAFGPEHHQLAHALSGLANIYLEQENYAEAELLYGRSLRIYELVVGSTNPDVAASLNNLGRLYQKQGKYGEAEPLYLRALRIQEQALEPEHPNIAATSNNLGELYREQGKYEEAEPLYQRAIRLWEASVGPEHLYTAQGLNNLAIIYGEQGKYEEAEQLHQRALRIRDRVLGPEHPEAAQSLTNLAVLSSVQGNYLEAELLVMHALEIVERTLGPQHPQTRVAHRFYGTILRAMGREEEAKLEEERSQRQEIAGDQTLQEEHALQYKLVHERLSELVERAPAEIKGMCSQILHVWEEAVVEESQTGEAFVLYGLPPKTITQLVPENHLDEGRNSRPWTDEGYEQSKENFDINDVDQNPFEVALDDEEDFYSWPLPLNLALQQAFDVTHQRFFTEESWMKQPDNPECRRIYRGILAATLALAKRGERE